MAYLIRRDAAERLIHVGLPAHLPADELLFRHRRTGLTVYGIEPPPVAHLGTPDGPPGFDSLVLADPNDMLRPKGLAERSVAAAGKVQRRMRLPH